RRMSFDCLHHAPPKRMGNLLRAEGALGARCRKSSFTGSAFPERMRGRPGRDSTHRGSSMKKYVRSLRDIVIAGFMFLVPVYVLFTKAWTSLSTIGTKLAAVFGLKSIFGVGGSTILSSLVLIAIWLVCGLLVRISFVGSLNKAVESRLAKYVPGYATYRAMIEERVHRKEPPQYASAPLRDQP